MQTFTHPAVLYSPHQSTVGLNPQAGQEAEDTKERLTTDTWEMVPLALGSSPKCGCRAPGSRMIQGRGWQVIVKGPSRLGEWGATGASDQKVTQAWKSGGHMGRLNLDQSSTSNCDQAWESEVWTRGQIELGSEPATRKILCWLFAFSATGLESHTIFKA